MYTLRKSFIIGMTVIGLSSAFAVQAQEATTPGRHAYAATKFDPVKRAEHFAQRQQKLHDALKLTETQETAWNTYIAAIKPQTPTGRPDRVDFNSLPAPERMEKRLALLRERLAKQEARLAALKTFYAVLTPEQQKTFDQATVRQGRHHGRQHHLQKQQG
ncbi:Spy/CpxP family protein refolding chaperone [Pseudoduganella chitinolytica]|uniref:Spy/CpxP family protein refolding chaperone n=1 Tax=Pseudoduganella chitinolytica TaxID=34070 RepID=A0ABY8B9X8_9BURK|nr:Spy/CpxP family protein refolding chaperone [Pseudoduganella chitinolytica]WEF32516.1 Spy/CpxP family protein refolding chaperone [Pseudoduganella chitinolytica]